jgi:lipopolysaccharide export system protein LptA
MSPAKARYDEVGRPPVTMSSKHAHIDESAHRATFEGDVQVDSATWRLQADRVEYDLKTGEVVASGRTKWLFTEGSAPTPQPPSIGKDGRR